MSPTVRSKPNHLISSLFADASVGLGERALEQLNYSLIKGRAW